MTEVKAVMTQEEFEQHHSRTWDYVARIGKIWEAIAEEQQAVLDGKGYRHQNYNSWEEYWRCEFAARTGWESGTIARWMTARRVKSTTPIFGTEEHIPSGVTQWSELATIESPEQRREFLDNYEDYKPIEPVRRSFRDAIENFKTERETGVIERMHEEDVVVPAYPTGPTPEEQAYNAASQLLSVAMDVTPEAAADSVSPGLAQTTAQRYEVLIPWTRRFVAQLHLRAGGGR